MEHMKTLDLLYDVIDVLCMFECVFTSLVSRIAGSQMRNVLYLYVGILLTCVLMSVNSVSVQRGHPRRKQFFQYKYI